MRSTDKEAVKKLLSSANCRRGALLYGKIKYSVSVPSFEWELHQFNISDGVSNNKYTREPLQDVQTSYSDLSVMFVSVPHTSEYAKSWASLALAMGYLDNVTEIVVMPPSCSDALSLEEIQASGLNLLYMEQANHIVFNITGGDLRLSNRISAINLPEYRLIFTGKLPLNIEKLIERERRRIVAEKMKYAFRSKFGDGGVGNPRRGFDKWDVFQHARAISLGSFELDAAEDLPPRGEWEQEILKLLADTDLSDSQSDKIQEELDKAVRQLEIYEAFWLSALEGAPVAPLRYRFIDENAEEIAKWAEILGVKPLIDAYKDGVSPEDIIAGEIEHREVKL